MESILNSVKKVVGLEETYHAFDQDIIMFINAAFSTLEQLGVGPEGGFSIIDEAAVWSDFYNIDDRYNAVRLYVCLRVRMAFDPPATSYHTTAMKDQIQELEWRLNVVREDYVTADTIILDGGGP